VVDMSKIKIMGTGAEEDSDSFVDILGVSYNIFHLPDDKMQGSSGVAALDSGSILLNKSINKQRQSQRLLHEVIHIISDELELNLGEKQVMGLAAGLYSMGIRIKERK
jgi:hypothetical protein